MATPPAPGSWVCRLHEHHTRQSSLRKTSIMRTEVVLAVHPNIMAARQRTPRSGEPALRIADERFGVCCRPTGVLPPCRSRTGW